MGGDWKIGSVQVEVYAKYYLSIFYYYFVFLFLRYFSRIYL